MTKSRMGMTADDIAEIRRLQLGGIFAKADSALAQRRVTVTVKGEDDYNSSDAPAWTVGGRDITIQQLHGQADFLSTQGLIVANGLNYHELCHVLYTPHHNTYLGQRVDQAGVHAAYNILEDQRIEGIITAKYRPTRPYLTACVAEFFMSDAAKQRSQVDEDTFARNAWFVVYGRKYLPAQMRDYFAQHVADGVQTGAWLSKKDHARQEAIVDEYMRLRFGRVVSSKTADTVIKLCTEYLDLMRKVQPDPSAMPNPFQHGGSAHGGDSGQAGGSDAGQPSTADGTSPSDKGQGDTAKGQGGQDSGDGSSDGSGDDSAQDGDDGNGGDSGDSADGGHGAGSGSANGSMADVLGKTLQAVSRDANVVDDISRQRQTIGISGNKFDGLLPDGSARNSPSLPEYSGMAKRFGKQLQMLSADADPGFDRHKDTGRLNVMRLVRGDSPDTVFDQWREGKHDVESLEVVVLVDTSYSMNSIIANAFNAAWVIKRGIDTLSAQARCSVIGFGGRWEYVYRPNSTSSGAQVRRVSTSGGTAAAPALKEAHRVLAMSDRKHKLLITVSDGSWDDRYTAVPIVEKMTESGVITAALLLTEKDWWADECKQYGEKAMTDAYINGHRLFVVGDGPMEIAALGKRLVKSAMTR